MYQERMNFIKGLAREAGLLTLEGYGKCHQMPKDGQDGYDIATEYDLRTEDLIKRRIVEEFGEPVLGEEDGLLGDLEVARDRLWIVDPIDGTFNYQRGLPFYGVSVAFCEKGVPICGAIFLPVLDQLFFAAKGAGAFLSERDTLVPVPIGISQERELARLIVSLAGRDTYRLVAACAGEGIPWRSLRLSLCAVASLTGVASGRMDAFFDTSLNLWDCAAGDIILREAGGPGPFDYRGVPIFPEYVKRRLDLGDTNGFTCVAVSGQELFQNSLHNVLAAAGFRTQETKAG